MGFEYKTLTTEDIQKANSYIPLMKKMEIVSTISERCFETLNITAGVDGNTIAMPPVYREDTALKSRYLMAIFVIYYLNDHIETENDQDEYLIAVDEYDKYAGGHIFEQLNRFKSDVNLRDKCYEMFNDYKDVCWRLDKAIQGLLVAMNDPVSRIMATITSNMSPEAVESTMAGFKEAQTTLEQLKGRIDEKAQEED